VGVKRWLRRLRRPPESIPADAIVATLVRALREAHPAPAGRVGWLLSVPDAQQRTLLETAEAHPELATLTCATEDEAHAIAAGLWIGGEPSVLSIQHAGLLASLNALHGVAIRGRIPMPMLVGLRGREAWLDPRDSHVPLVRDCEPVLDALGVPHVRLERAADLRRIPELLRLAHERRGPTALLVGRETA